MPFNPVNQTRIQMTLFHGLSAFPITPADSHGKVDTIGLERLIERLADAGVDSIGLLGSTGTYAYLTRSEKRRAIQATVDVLDGRIPLIVGIGALRTDAAQQLACDARDAGADGLLLAPVSYTPLTEDEAYQHYLCVAGATDLPLCIYNNPGTTHFQFTVTLIERLAAVSNIAAVKMPLPQNDAFSIELEQLRTNTPESFAVGYSGDWGCPKALLAGADAWYSVVGGLFPASALQLTRAAQARNVEEVQRIERHFYPLWELLREFGGLRVMYAAANILSLTDASPPRPILPLKTADQERVAAAIGTLNALQRT